MGRRRAARIAAAVLGVLVLAELLVRVRTDSLPPHQIWPTMQMQLQDERIRALEARGGASVVFLGTSSVGVSVDPSALRNIRSSRPGFNAAVGGATLSFVETWARREVIPRLRPQTIVLGMTPLELSGANRWPILDARFDEWRGVRHLYGTETPIDVAERQVESWSTLVRYRTLIRQPDVFGSFIGVHELEADLPPARVAAPDGQVLVFESRPYRNVPFIERRSAQDLAGRYEIGGPELFTLYAFVTDLAEAADRLVVVSMPVTHDYLTALPNGRADKAKFDIALHAAAERVGARFVNAGVWPTSDFADPTHVNARGSRRVTSLIDRVLREAIA